MKGFNSAVLIGAPAAVAPMGLHTVPSQVEMERRRACKYGRKANGRCRKKPR